MKKRALSLRNIFDYQPKTVTFTGRWHDSIGDPELSGSWIIFGHSGQGKTSFTTQLVKYLMSFKGVRIAYAGLEEGLSATFQQALRRAGILAENHRRFILWPRYTMDEFEAAVDQKRSANIIVIDSVQYLGITYEQYQELVKKHPHKLFIWISHASGKNPKGAVADSIRYNCDVKIRVDSFMAYVISRYNGGRPFDIWPEKTNHLTE